MAMNPDKKMLMANLFGDINTSTSSDMEIKMIPLDLIDDRVLDGQGHPFEKSMLKGIEELAESIKIIGIQQPIVVAPKGERYVSLAGHRRRRGVKLAGVTEVPAIVKDIDPFSSMADLIVTDTNLKNRKALYPSEIATAYQMQLDALKEQGKRKDLIEAVNDCSEDVAEEPLTARDIIAQRYETTATEISKYVRLLKLIPELLEKVDEGNISVKAGYILSFLDPIKQKKILSLPEISISKAEELRNLSDEEWENFGNVKPNKKEKKYTVQAATRTAMKKYKGLMLLNKEDEKALADALEKVISEFATERGIL